MKPDRDAVVVVARPGGDTDLRPGLFVYPTADGFAWVEPGYLEPDPSREAFYRATGTLQLQANGFTLDAQDGKYYVVGALADLDEGTGADLKAACAWARQQIEAAGSTMDAERDRLRLLLADDLA